MKIAPDFWLLIFFIAYGSAGLLIGAHPGRFRGVWLVLLVLISIAALVSAVAVLEVKP